MGKETPTDLAWEKFGQTDPYFGVCSGEIFKSTTLTDDALKTFFESGEEHVNHVLDVLNWMSAQKVKLKSVLDFGCGTGRLILPFSSKAERVTGIDVSRSMLNEAEKNLKRRGINNVELIQSNSLDVLQDRKFDLVHTYIVLQHVPVSSGYELIQSLLNAIAPGGYAMIHFTYRDERSVFKDVTYHLRFKYKLLAQLSNIIKGKSPGAPDMQMNNYDLNQVFRIVEEAGVKNFYSEFTNHSGFHGVGLYILKV